MGSCVRVTDWFWSIGWRERSASSGRVSIDWTQESPSDGATSQSARGSRVATKHGSQEAGQPDPRPDREPGEEWPSLHVRRGRKEGTRTSADPAPDGGQSSGQSAAVGPVVLQKGTGIFDVSLPVMSSIFGPDSRLLTH